MMRRATLIVLLVLMAGQAAVAARAASPPLRIGYSDWPGWVAWQIAIDKGWLTQAGLDVKFDWFDYSASMDAYAAGQIDADLVTNTDALVMGAGGARNVIVLITDYSSGNDMIVARPGIKSMRDLLGRKIGVEVGLVDHLLLLDALGQAGLKASDVTLVNVKTNETPQVLASGQVDAIAAWQPNAGLAMKALPGAHPIFTSAEAPGLIYDVLSVNPASLASHRADYLKLIGVWDRIVRYINDPKTQADAVQIMSARVGLTPAQYQRLLAGTHLIGVEDAKKLFRKAPDLGSIYGSTQNADAFNVRNAVYKQPQKIDSYIDPSLTAAQP